jgi:hypothetical protein
MIGLTNETFIVLPDLVDTSFREIQVQLAPDGLPNERLRNVRCRNVRSQTTGRPGSSGKRPRTEMPMTSS